MVLQVILNRAIWKQCSNFSDPSEIESTGSCEFPLSSVCDWNFVSKLLEVVSLFGLLYSFSFALIYSRRTIPRHTSSVSVG